jgi:hypothetical protein
MMEERYHATTQNQFYPDMSNVNKNITVEAKLTSPPTYIYIYISVHPVGGGGGGLKGCSCPLNQNLKKQRFNIQDDVKCFTFFTLQSKSAIEIC